MNTPLASGENAPDVRDRAVLSSFPESSVLCAYRGCFLKSRDELPELLARGVAKIRKSTVLPEAADQFGNSSAAGPQLSSTAP